LKTPNKHY
jgi:hypothetical protein